MSKKRIITISRSFGSGGRMIGEELARRLEYHFYDRNLLDLLSEKTGISEQGLGKCGTRNCRRRFWITMFRPE